MALWRLGGESGICVGVDGGVWVGVCVGSELVLY